MPEGPPTTMSTPIRRQVGRSEEPEESPILRKKKRAARLNYTIEGRQEVLFEPNDRTEAKWVAKPAASLRFIDDCFSLSKVNFENSYSFKIGDVCHRVKHAVQTQNVFRHIVKRATESGMVVNAEKTMLVCVSDAPLYEPDAYFYDSDGLRIGSTDSFKALGMYFSNRLTMDKQVEAIQKAVRSRIWMLRNLKGHGFNEEELLKVYKTIIRPAIEYGVAVYHSSLTDEQDEKLEGLQVTALKAIFDPFLSGRRLRDRAGITTLRTRREEIAF